MAVLGSARCHGGKCYCQKFKLTNDMWFRTDENEWAFRLRAQTDCGFPDSETTSGLVAYLHGEPVGWCAVEPRIAYPKLLVSPVPWTDRNEDTRDGSIWAVTCFIVRKSWRRRGITYALARAAADFAKERGARAVEGYPMMTEKGKEITWGELHVGSINAFLAAGFRVITRTTKRRAVVRIDFH